MYKKSAILGILALSSLVHCSAYGASEAENLRVPYYLVGEPITLPEIRSGEKGAIFDYSGVELARVESAGQELKLEPGYYEFRSNGKVIRFLVGYERKNIPSVVGLDAHLVETMSASGDFLKELPRQLYASKMAGAWYIRDRFRWNSFEPEAGTWKDKVFETTFQPQIDAGFELVLAVEGNASWSCAIPDGKMNLGHPTEEAWKNLFSKLSEKYANQPIWWQVWNEPNPIGIAGARYPGGITPDKYIEHFLKPAGEAVKASGDKIRLMIGGSAGMDLPWQQGLAEKKAMQYVNAFDIHPYAVTPRQFEIQMKEVLGYLDKAGFEGPIFASEAHGDTPDVLAQLYIAWFSLDERMRKGALFNFDLQDWQVPSGLQEALKLGIISTDYAPKPTMAVMNLIGHRLAGAQYLATIAMNDQVSIHAIKDSEGVPFVTAYSHDAFNGVTFLTKAPEIKITSPAGGRPIIQKQINGLVFVPLKAGKFSYIDGASDLKLTDPLVSPGAAVPTPGSGKLICKVPVEFSNPTDAPLTFQASLIGNESLDAILTEPEITVAPKAKRTYDIRISYRGGDIPVGVQTIDLNLVEAKSGFSTKIPVNVQIDPGYQLSAKLDRDKKGVLNQLGLTVGNSTNTTSVSITLANGTTLKSATSKSGVYEFSLPDGALQAGQPTPLSVRIMEAGGPHYLYKMSISSLNSVESRLDEELNQDMPLNSYFAQPFRADSNTISSVALNFNNWSDQPHTVKIAIREQEPDGKTLAETEAEIPPGGNQWIDFNFPLIKDVQLGGTYWIVTRTAGTDDGLRWIGRNPYMDRVTDAKSSFEGAAWNPIEPQDFRWLGLSYRIFR